MPSNNKQQKKKQNNERKPKSNRRKSVSRRSLTIGQSSPGQMLVGQQKMEESCAKDYFQSLLDPYNANPCCLPLFPALPSLKGKCWIKGTLSTGAAGSAFIQVNPTLANDATLAQGCAAIVSNVSWGFGRTATAAERTVVTGGLSGLNFNSPYTVAMLATVGGVEWRVVSLGIRVRYTGPEIERGGTIYCLEDPDHMDLQNESPPTLMAFPKCYRSQVNRDWVTCNWVPKRATEVEYTSNYSYTIMRWPLLVYIQAASNTSVTYEYEITMNYESIGSYVPTRTMSYAADPAVKSGLASLNSGPVQGIMDGFLSTYTGQPLLGYASNLIGRAIGNAASYAVPAMLRQSHSAPRLTY